MINSELLGVGLSVDLQQDNIAGKGLNLGNRMVFKDLVWDVECTGVLGWWIKEALLPRFVGFELLTPSSLGLNIQR